MDELSLYVLDITMNSVRAGATDISIELAERGEWLDFTVRDNGCGMTEEQLAKLENPFFTIEKILTRYKGEYDISVLDFHAEATSEKQALAHYLDGRLTVFFGTHTHVATADECILPKGTAYITDVGMCGPDFSVLGIKPECIIEKMTTGLPVKFIPSTGKVTAHGIVVEVDRKTKKATSIQRITF